MQTLWFNFVQLLLLLDQGCNWLISTLTGRKGWADETMSAHCWRSYRDGKLWGQLFKPPIDLLFAWQKADPAIINDAGEPITGRCERAFYKEKQRRYMPPEYR